MVQSREGFVSKSFCRPFSERTLLTPMICCNGMTKAEKLRSVLQTFVVFCCCFFFFFFIQDVCARESGVLRVVTFTTSEVTFFIFLKSEGHFEVTFEKCPKK